ACEAALQPTRAVCRATEARSSQVAVARSARGMRIQLCQLPESPRTGGLRRAAGKHAPIPLTTKCGVECGVASDANAGVAAAEWRYGIRPPVRIARTGCSRDARGPAAFAALRRLSGGSTSTR